MAVDKRGWYLHHASDITALGTVVNTPQSPHFQGEQITALFGPLVGLPRVPFGYHREGDDPVVATPGSTLWSNTNQLFERHPLDSRGEVTDWLWVRPDLVIDAAAIHAPEVREYPDQPFGFAIGPANSKDQLSIRMLVAAAQSDMADSAELDEAILVLFGNLVASAFRQRGTRRQTRQATTLAHRTSVNESLILLAKQPSRRWTIDELAKQVHISPLHFCRIFKHLTGYTIREYQLQLRLAMALDILEQGADSISEVARISGFSSGAHLSDALLNHAGIRPNAAKKSFQAASTNRLRRLMENHANPRR